MTKKEKERLIRIHENLNKCGIIYLSEHQAIKKENSDLRFYSDIYILKRILFTWGYS